MKKILFVFLFFGYANGQMETGNDLFTALNSVNDIKKLCKILYCGLCYGALVYIERFESL